MKFEKNIQHPVSSTGGHARRARTYFNSSSFNVPDVPKVPFIFKLGLDYGYKDGYA